MGLAERDALGGTGLSRESVRCHAAELRVFTLASSRLKPVPLWKCISTVGLALAGKASDVGPQN